MGPLASGWAASHRRHADERRATNADRAEHGEDVAPDGRRQEAGEEAEEENGGTLGGIIVGGRRLPPPPRARGTVYPKVVSGGRGDMGARFLIAVAFIPRCVSIPEGGWGEPI